MQVIKKCEKKEVYGRKRTFYDKNYTQVLCFLAVVNVAFDYKHRSNAGDDRVHSCINYSIIMKSIALYP